MKDLKNLLFTALLFMAGMTWLLFRYNDLKSISHGKVYDSSGGAVCRAVLFSRPEERLNLPKFLKENSSDCALVVHPVGSKGGATEYQLKKRLSYFLSKKMALLPEGQSSEVRIIFPKTVQLQAGEVLMFSYPIPAGI